MKPFVAIIGGKNAGKSTIIKSLTGCRTAQFRGTVVDTATGRSIEVIGSSPQEIALSLAELRRILKRASADPQCTGVVCALQPNNPTTRLSLEDVLLEALAIGFAVRAFVLDPPRSGASVSLASVVRRLPKGVRKPVTLDARRFSHLNAIAINARTRIAA